MAVEYQVKYTPGFDPTIVNVSQNDVGRQFDLKIIDETGAAQQIPSGSTVKFVGMKPSGLGFTVNCTFTNSVVHVTTTDIMTDEHGLIPAEVQITNGNTVIGTANVNLRVEKNPHPEGTIDDNLIRIIPTFEVIYQRLDILESSMYTAENNISNLQTRVGIVEVKADDAYDIGSQAATMASAYAVEIGGIKRGYDGTVYQTAGDAVRAQAFRGTDTTLSVSGKAADAKVTGDEFSGLKSAIGYTICDKVIASPSGTLFTVNDTPIGTLVYYSFDVNTGKSGYLELFNANNQRISYIGKGASSTGDLHYDGYFVVPDTFSYAKFSGSPQNITVNYILNERANKSLDIRLNSVINDVDDIKNGVINNDEFAVNTSLFTLDDVSVGDVICYDLTARTGYAGYISLFSPGGVRIAYYGKGSSSYTENHYVGTFTIPENFSYAKVEGGTITLQTIRRNSFDSVYSEIESLQTENQKVNTYLMPDANRFNPNNATDGYFLQVSNYNETVNASGAISEFIRVAPGDYITVNLSLGSSTYGHVFYDTNKIAISAIASTDQNLTFTVPANAAYIRFSLLAAKKADFTVYITNYQRMANEAAFEAREKCDFYGRHTIKAVGAKVDGYIHDAFPSMCFFNSKQYIVSRLGQDHLTPTDSSKWGGCVFDIRDSYGNWEHSTMFTADDFSGLSGEIRDTCIRVTKDGKYLVFTSVTTYYDANQNALHDNLIAILDSDLQVVTYKVFVNVSRLFYGGVIITPENRVIVGGWGDDKSGIWYSDPVADFTDFSSLTMTYKQLYESAYHATECCIGYLNNELIFLSRVEGTNTIFMKTSNLEGMDGWGEAIDTGIKLHAPKVLQSFIGKYMPVVGAYLDHDTSVTDRLRYPIIGYLDTSTGKFIGYANVDETITGYSGYTDLVYFGGENYGLVYYQEIYTGVPQTALYYRMVNARNLIPQLVWYM